MPPRLRPLLLTVGAAAAATVLVPLVVPASAAACASFADSPTDGGYAPAPGGPSLDTDPSLEITTVSAGVVDGAVTFRTTVKKLAASPAKHTGDNFETSFKIGGKAIRTYAFRYNPAAIGDVHSVGYNNTGLYVDGAYKLATPVIAAYDLTASAVTIRVKLTDLAALGVATTGEVSELTASASGAFSRLSFMYDTASGGATTFSTGTPCSFASGPAPTTGPTATPTSAPPTSAPPTSAPPTSAPPTTAPPAGGLPAGYPAAGCNTFTDGKGDGTPDAPVANGGAPVAEGQNDPDLDIVGVALGSTDTDFVAAVRLDDLKALPALPMGHSFEVTFVHNTKTITLYAQQYDTAGTAGRTVLANNPQGAPAPTTGGRLAGTYNANLKVTSTFDVTNNLVLFKLTRDSLAAVAGAPAPDGTTFTVVSASTRQITTPLGGTLLADTAQHTDPTQRTFTIGDGPCYGPPAGVLANAGVTTVQYGDAAAVAAKLTSGAGDALAGKTVTFTIGGVSKTGVTGADGIARASLAPAATAGAHSLVASFAGDSAAGKAEVTTPFTVVVEKTKVVLSVAKAGTRRTVTAKLLDDDGKPVAGQTITWYVNGAKGASVKTSSAGIATLTTAKPTQTVKAVFAGLTGKYAGASAQLKV